MSDTHHTPGPWIAEQNSSFWDIRVDSNNFIGIGDVCISQFPENIRNPCEQEANARLIAAAPELLEALQICFENCHTWNGNSGYRNAEFLEKARAAIAKATGENQTTTN